MIPRLSIIIPCYNEENNIKECIRQIPEMAGDVQIIVIDDGSTDKTADVARSINRPNLKVIRCDKNSGKGAALKVGLHQAACDIVVILDADYTTPPQEIPRIVEPIWDGRADFVNGTRFLYPMEKHAMKKTHVLSNKISALIISLCIGQRITDSLCGLKAFRKDLFIGKLKESSWPDFELLIKAKRNKMRIIEVPIHYKARKTGISKMNTFKGIYEMPRLLFKSLIES